MSSTKKQIVIDSSSLSGSGSTSINNTTLKRQRKTKPQATTLLRHTLKQNLLQKIKEHQSRNEETPGNHSNNSNNNPSNQDLANQFKMSTNYLEHLMHKKKEARVHNKKSLRSQMQQPQMVQPQMVQPQMVQPQMVQPQMVQPQMVQPQMLQPQMVQPQMVQPQMVQPQMQQPQMVQPQMVQPPQMQEVSLELPPELQINTVMMHSVIPPIVQEQSDPLNSEPLDSVPATQIPNPAVLNDVPYGCLRNGNKPTFRTYHRNRGQSDHHHNTTVKHPLFSGTGTTAITVPIPSDVTDFDSTADPMIQERQRKLREIQENSQKSNTSNAITEPIKQKNKIKQTITKKYKLGKTPGSNVVGVLIKNSDTRRRIQEEHGILRRDSIVDIRKYLHEHGLVKVGSDAPPDVLRNIYESAKMTGEISNTNKNVMLHNFLKSDDNGNERNNPS
jgi:hypothetical protein